MTSTSSARDIVVVGAGVFGAAAALTLRARGWDVTVVDRGPLPHADASSTDVSKMVRMDYGSDVFYHELAEAAIEGWERWNHDWPRPLYHGDGFLVLSAGPMRPGGFEFESHRVLVERGYAPERIDGAALERRCPRWNGAGYPDGYVSPRGGWAESGAVVERLVELGRAAGVTFLDATFSGLLSAGSRVSGVRVAGPVEGTGLATSDESAATAATATTDVTDEGATTAATDQSAPTAESAETAVTAGHVLMCVGAWTPTLLPWTAHLLRTIAQPVLHFGVERPDDFRGPHFPPFAADIAGSGWYGFPALDDGRVKLGHHGPGRLVAPDDRGEVADEHLARARAFLADAIPALAEAPVVGRRVCLYCDSMDGDLLVDHDPDREGLVVATGGSGHAFKFAPMIGHIVADAVEGHPSAWLPRFRWREPDAARHEEARLQNPKGTVP